MEQAYAQALWQMVENGMAPAKAVHAMRDSLKSLGREALLPRVGRAFARIAMREAKRTGVTLSIARMGDERGAKSAVKEILAELDVEPKDVNVHVDDSLIGGWRLEGKEALVDASYKKELLELFNRSVRA
jgi:F0F1-type ATP synthase delta subunit